MMGGFRKLCFTYFVGMTKYLCKDYFKCICADCSDINNDATLDLQNATFKNYYFPCAILQSSLLLHRDQLFFFFFLVSYIFPNC